MLSFQHICVCVLFFLVSNDFNLWSVWFFCCVTVDAINDTMAAFYNDTDLFSGEFWHPLVFKSPTPPNLEIQTLAFYPLTLILQPDNPPFSQYHDLFKGEIWQPLVPPSPTPQSQSIKPIFSQLTLTPKSKKNPS